MVRLDPLNGLHSDFHCGAKGGATLPRATVHQERRCVLAD
jgi:hypothetical protein